MLDVVCFHIFHGEPDEEITDNNELNQNLLNLENIGLDDYLKSEQCSLLEHILNELKNVNQVKWFSITSDDLYPELLTNGESIMKELTVKELHVIAQELHCITDHTWHTSNMLKWEIVNSIVKAFGGEVIPADNISKHKKQVLNPETLTQMCTSA